MKVFFIFVVLIIHFAFNTKFLNASGFNESYSLRSGLSAVNEAGFIFNIMKKCSGCEETKSLDNFHINNSKKDKHCSRCKKCRLVYWAAYRKANKYKIKKYRKIYNYNRENKKKRNEQLRKRRETDINFRISGILRTRMTGVIKSKYKSGKTIELLGCDISFFKKYLEKLFTRGMTWKKYMEGKIHLDHIIPCSRFDLTKADQQKRCFHYSNLQPLWIKDNLKKYNKLVEIQLKLLI